MRGAIRNVFEIITFSKMQLVGKNHYGFRDLNGAVKEVYRTQVQAEDVRSGWLKFDGNEWQLYACEAYKVKHEDICSSFGNKIKAHIKRLRDSKTLDKPEKLPGTPEDWLKKCSAKEKYESVGGLTQVSYHEKSANLCSLSAGNQTGYLVFIGPGTTNKNPHEWVFSDVFKSSANKPDFILSPELIKQFCNAHGFQETLTVRTENIAKKHLKYLWDKPLKEFAIPVFYVLDKAKGDVKYLGLAQLPRIACKTTALDVIKNVSEDHINESVRDMTEMVFGCLERPDESALKSRISFSPCFLNDQDQSRNFSKPEKQNYAPKPTFFPAYLKQNVNFSGNKLEEKIEYKTFMNADAEIKGWKRYPVTKPTGMSQTTFNGCLRFHNLKPEELGALLWAITWGDQPQYFHKLGQSKPQNSGLTRITIDWDKSEVFLNNVSRDRLSPKDISTQKFIKKFEEKINQAYCENQFLKDKKITWLDAPQIQSLLAMASASAFNRPTTYMELDQHRQCKNNREVLPYCLNPQPLEEKQIFHKNLLTQSIKTARDEQVLASLTTPEAKLLHEFKKTLNQEIEQETLDRTKGIISVMSAQTKKMQGWQASDKEQLKALIIEAYAALGDKPSSKILKRFE